ncbi:MAG: zinc-ribbon domain-containing protein, partial [Planctomycetota bacterium]
MLIQCPSCQARAKLSDDHEGAKVRCAECGRVYVARPQGAKGTVAAGNNTGLGIGIGVGVVLLLFVFFLVSRSGDEPVVAEAPKVAPPPVAKVETDDGWKNELVQAMVKLHTAAFAGDRETVKTFLHGARIWAREHTSAEGVLDPTVPPFESLPPHEKVDALNRWAEEFCSGPSKELVADWMPYDGQLIEQGDLDAFVRVAVKPRAGGVESRWVEWSLTLDGNRYKAWKWERWLSPDEVKAAKKKKGYDVKTLSDGSIVHEREPAPLGHLADTPEELRKEIDSLLATMLDLELTKEGGRARARLVEIGKPAIPPLLTKFYEIPADDEPNRIRCNMIDQALSDITGQHFGYAPGEAGTAAGTTEERRASSIKQWFAWWYKNEKRFTTKVVED